MTGGRPDRLVAAVRRLLRRPMGLASIVVLTTVLVPATALLTTVWLFGWQLQVVRTDSMSPTFPKGTLLVAEPVTPSEVEPGDVVTFAAPWRDGTLVTHRVQRVLVDPEGLRRFVTRGDASDADDPSPVAASDVRAAVRWGIPSLGSLVWLLRGWRTPLLLVILPLVLLVADSWRSRRRVPCPTCGRPVNA